jgi:hypothetical protein
MAPRIRYLVAGGGGIGSPICVTMHTNGAPIDATPNNHTFRCAVAVYFWMNSFCPRSSRIGQAHTPSFLLHTVR